MLKQISSFVLAGTLVITSVSFAQQSKTEQIRAIDKVAVQMGIEGSNASYLAMEVLGKLDSKQRAEKLQEEENNLILLKQELSREEARLAAAQKVMLDNNLMHTAYTLTSPILIVGSITGAVSGIWSGIAWIEKSSTLKTAGRVFWTSALTVAIAYATQEGLQEQVILEKEHVAKLLASVREIKNKADRVQQVVEILKKFYRIDVNVNVKVE